MKAFMFLSLILTFTLGCQPYTQLSNANPPDAADRSGHGFTGHEDHPEESRRAQEVYRTEVISVENPLLDIRTSGGGVFIEGSDRSTVEVLMIVRRNGKIVSPGEADLDDYTITIEQRGNTIVAHAERASGWTWGWGKPNYSITFRLNTPRTAQIDAHTSGGSMKASGIEGPIELNTSGGSITLEETYGDAVIQTSGGGLEVNNHTGRLEGRTSGGSISVRNLLGDADIRTSGGNIRAENISGAIFARTSGGNIRAEISEISGDMDFSTSGGNVRIDVPAGTGLDLDLSGNSVNVELVNFTGEAKRDRIKGSMNGGGVLLRGKTSGGSVSVTFMGEGL